MPPTNSYPLIDRIFGGRLAAWLAQSRADGDSFQTIANRLFVEHGIRVSDETIRRWCSEQSKAS